MSKRALAIWLIIGGVLAILAVLAWLFFPFLKQQVTQPPPLVPSTLPKTTQGTQTPSTPTTPPVAGSPAERERIAEEAIKQQTIAFTARAGTYSNADSFASIEQVYAEVTPALRDYLEAQRKQLIQQHPPYGSSWGQTTRSVASRITSALPLLGKSSAEVTVQAQVVVEAAGSAPVVSYQEIVVSYQNVNGTWIASRITTRPWQPQ